MKFKKISKKLMAAMLTGAMLVSMMGMTAFAAVEDNEEKEAASSDMQVTLTKFLDMSDAEGAGVPDVDFNFTVIAGNKQEARIEAGKTYPEILAGIGNAVKDEDENDVTDDEGNPVLWTVEVSFADGYYTDEENETIVCKDFAIDFSDVEFTAPGIYRYIITEDDPGDEGLYADIDPDENTYYLDVYVVNDDDNEERDYKISSWKLLDSEEQPTISENKTSYTSKKNGFTNSFETYDLTLEKNVTGPMGDKGREFEFTIVFTGPLNAAFTLEEGTTPEIVPDEEEGATADEIVLDDEEEGTTVPNIVLSEEVTETDEDGNPVTKGSKEVPVKLADGDSVIIKGIPSTVSYVIKEKIPEKDGYTTTYTFNETSVSASRGTGNDVDYVNSMKITMGKADNSVVCTNDKDTITPTGGLSSKVCKFFFTPLSAA